MNNLLSQTLEYSPTNRTQRLVKRIDTDDHLNCYQYNKIDRFKKIIKNEDIIYYLNNGSPAIKIIVIEKLFETKTEKNSKELISSIKNIKNEYLFLCKDISASLLLDYVLFRIEVKELKDNNIEIYNLIINLERKTN